MKELSIEEKQKPAWSEEDERIINSCIYCFEQDLKELKNDKVGHSEIISDLEEGYKEKIDFLKSLKDRVQPQPIQEWSEEDKRSIRDSIFYLKSAKKYFEKDDDILWDEKWFNLCIEFLEALYKRLQPQPQWKPSDEQMKVLDVAIMNSHLTTAEYDGLVKLREQLKSL